MNDYAKSISGITRLTNQAPFLSGEDVLLAVIDSGIDYRNDEFKDEQGNTRIAGIWDLSDGSVTGKYYDAQMIQQAINENVNEGYQIVPEYDRSGHGTAVTGVAAGTYGGIARKSDILVVKINNESNQLLTTSLMRGIDFAINYALEQNKPLVINLSIGNTYGDHQGYSLLERFIDNACEVGKTSIVVGSGNEGNSRGHTAGQFLTEETIQLAVADYEKELLIQLWKYKKDVYEWNIIAPNGDSVSQNNTSFEQARTLEVTLGDTTLLCYLGVPLPYQTQQEFLVQLLPKRERGYINAGIWNFVLRSTDGDRKEYRFYLSGSGIRNRGTGFLRPTPDVTLTIPSTARKVITVGAYDVTLQSYADFSGRGYVFQYQDQTAGRIDLLTAYVKPDLVAPGVGITVPTGGGGYEEVSGTSFATPFVSGTAALLMEWGIVRENDPYMYAEKLKAYLQTNARKVSGINMYPNAMLGWGALDIQNSLD